MKTSTGKYTDWGFIDYKPAITEVLPHTLLPYISNGQTALDIGCNTGGATIFLAKHGVNVLGVDINKQAIAAADEHAERLCLSTGVRFMGVDIMDNQDLGTFDVVLMIRLLTCFPSLRGWHRLQQCAYSLLKAGGIIYINDFMLTEESKIYHRRYEAGFKSGGRHGNFAVNDANGNLLFIAHHHSEDELQEITAPYNQMECHFYRSLSMNGNVCNMFEFIGQKPQDIYERFVMSNSRSIFDGVSLKDQIEYYQRDEAPNQIRVAAEKCEKRFGIQFDTLTYFPKALLNTLHKAQDNPIDLPSNVVIASHTDLTILPEMEVLGEIANSASITFAQRKQYYDILKDIYSKLILHPEMLQHENTLWVAPEREGRILAESMGWLLPGQSLRPHAKRILYKGGLIVGLSGIEMLQSYDRCIIIDGAIASGATLTAIIMKLRSISSRFHIYSVHSAYEGLQAILRYGLEADVKINITVGHATAGINKKFYAVVPGDEKQVVVGDLGDTIS